jgi:hypothetical protein
LEESRVYVHLTSFQENKGSLSILKAKPQTIDSFETDIICMARLNIVPSPHSEVVVRPHDDEAFPEFTPLFEATVAPQGLPEGFLFDPSEALTVVVLENRSEKAI